MTYPNDNRPLASQNRSNRPGVWVVLAVCLVAIIVAAIYYNDRNRNTASSTSTPTTTTGSAAGNPGAAQK
jgi:hypothetical protein